MPVENCHKVVSTIDSFSAGDTVIWSEENVKKLLPFVPLKDMCKLHTCYIVAKKDGSSLLEATVPRFKAMWR